MTNQPKPTGEQREAAHRLCWTAGMCRAAPSDNPIQHGSLCRDTASLLAAREREAEVRGEYRGMKRALQIAERSNAVHSRARIADAISALPLSPAARRELEGGEGTP